MVHRGELAGAAHRRTECDDDCTGEQECPERHLQPDSGYVQLGPRLDEQVVAGQEAKDRNQRSGADPPEPGGNGHGAEYCYERNRVAEDRIQQPPQQDRGGEDQQPDSVVGHQAWHSHIGLLSGERGGV